MADDAPKAAVCAFDYEPSRRYAAQLGLAFQDSIVPYVDGEFAKAGLNQAQVDGVMRLGAWWIAHVLNPRSYGWRQRLAIAAMFLLNRSLTRN